MVKSATKEISFNERVNVHNADIPDLLALLAGLLEIEGANPLRIRACRNGARTTGDPPVWRKLKELSSR